MEHSEYYMHVWSMCHFDHPLESSTVTLHIWKQSTHTKMKHIGMKVIVKYDCTLSSFLVHVIIIFRRLRMKRPLCSLLLTASDGKGDCRFVISPLADPLCSSHLMTPALCQSRLQPVSCRWVSLLSTGVQLAIGAHRLRHCLIKASSGCWRRYNELASLEWS